MNKTKELGSCAYNCGVNCTGVNDKCKQCGWNPAISKQRIAAIRSGNLRTNSEGKTYLKINGRGEPDAV